MFVPGAAMSGFLRPCSVGPVLVQPLVESGEIIELSRRFITPYYRAKAAFACEELRRELAGVPHQIHSPEGAFFLWLWFPGLPIKSAELYGRLKKAGVFVLSGHYFFPGLEEPWAHVDECIRVSFTEAEPIVREGIRRIGAEVDHPDVGAESRVLTAQVLELWKVDRLDVSDSDFQTVVRYGVW